MVHYSEGVCSLTNIGGSKKEEMLFWAEKTECLFDVLGGSYVLDF